MSTPRFLKLLSASVRAAHQRRCMRRTIFAVAVW
jgi:hypothetical protein